MKKIYSLVLLIFLLSGCSITKPAITEYRLSLKDFSQKSYKQTCKDKSLKVSAAFSSNSLMTKDMNYMQNRHKIYSYSESKWSNSPNQEISSQILSAIRDAKLFSSVQNSKSRSKSDYILEINIQDFMQYFSNDLTSSNVNAVICLTLIDADSNRVISSKTFTSKQSVKSLDAVGGVEALDEALKSIIDEGLDFISEVCR